MADTQILLDFLQPPSAQRLVFGIKKGLRPIRQNSFGQNGAAKSPRDCDKIPPRSGAGRIAD